MEKKLVTAMMLTLLLGSLLFSATRLVKGETETHDLRIVLEAGPSLGGHHLTYGESRILNTTVWNDGNVTEPEVTLLLLINGSEVVHSIVANLSSRSFYRSSYDWYPSKSGVYNVTAYAPPITYPEPETNTANNVASWLINVCNDTAPIANFTNSPEDPIQNESVTFDASSSYDRDWGNITKYEWNFNGTIRNENESITTYEFEMHGNVNVTLTLYDTEGEKSNPTSKLLKVYAPPEANFEITQPRPWPGPYYINQLLTFNASASYDPDNDTGPTRGITNYTWDFGDGSDAVTTPNSTINYSYTENGTYVVNLTVTDSDNLNGSDVLITTVDLGYPIADWEITYPRPLPGPYYVNEILTFNASSSYDPDGGNITYSWDFGDGAPLNTTSDFINHTYTQANTYDVTLTVTDDEGLNDSKTEPVNVCLKVFMMVEPTMVNWSNPKDTFKVNITVANVIDLYKFSFNMTWLVDVLECLDADPGDFFGAPGDVNFEAEFPTGRNFVAVNGTSKVGGASGNGTLAIVTLRVTNPGNCTLFLIGTKLKKSTGIPIDHETVNGDFYTTSPVADFTYSPYPAVPNETVTFDASSSYDPDSPYGPKHGIVSYTWDFGDGSDSETTPNSTITHNFTSYDIFPVNLTVTDDNGEVWRVTRNVATEFRDIAIIDVKPSPFAGNETLGVYNTSGVLPISVTVINKGTTQETFNVTVYAKNATHTFEIGTQTISLLPPDYPKNLTFYLYASLWNDTHGLPKGNYNIFANITELLGETNTTDNTLPDGEVWVGLTGDVNGDTYVNAKDATRLGVAFGSEGDASTIEYWHDPPCYECPHDGAEDLNDDGWVNAKDAIIVGNHFGKHDC